MTRPDLSLVVAVRNQLPYNQLFLESLGAHTHTASELIVVDNSSADGSTELYRRHGAEVIPTFGNLCYPEAMNLGLRKATRRYVGFVNNDVYLGVGWDEAVLDAMEREHLDVACPSGVEKMLTRELTARAYARWDLVKRAGGAVRHVEDLRRLIRAMYGDWEGFCRQIRTLFQGRMVPGIVGSCVVVRRAFIDSLGGWDPRVQSGDWDLYLTIRDRIQRAGCGRPPMVVSWAYVHHFIRATAKTERAPFTCQHPRLSVEDKWGRAVVQRLWSDPEQVANRPRLLRNPAAYLRRRAQRTLAKWRRVTGLARARLVGLPDPEGFLALLRTEAAKMDSARIQASVARNQ